MVEDEPMSVEDWFALTPLVTLWSPLPTFTPGLMFAPALMSVLLMPTFASTPTLGFTLTELPLSGLLEVEPVADDWSIEVPWLIVDVEPWSVDDWLADTLLETDWSPEPEAVPTLTPGLTFTPAFTSLLAMPTLAPTPTFGFTLTPVPLVLPAPADVSVDEDCVEDALWSMVDDEFTSVDCWFAETLLDTEWSPLPMFTPGLMFALAFTSVFAMPTLASMPTLGLALMSYPL
jgi:hypothetical protein